MPDLLWLWFCTLTSEQRFTGRSHAEERSVARREDGIYPERSTRAIDPDWQSGRDEAGWGL